MGLIMRRNLMAAKSGYTANDYVKTGLVHMWDGIENVGYGSQNLSATVWKDLVGSTDLTLTDNGYFDSTSLVATGGERNDGLYNPAAIGPSLYSDLSKELSIEIVFKMTSRWGRSQGTIGPQFVFQFSRGGGTLDRVIGCLASGTESYKNLASCNVVNRLSAINFENYFFKKVNLSLSYLPNAAETTMMFVNTEVQNIIRVTGVNRNTNNATSVGGLVNLSGEGYYSMSGNFYCIRVYEKSLTSSEIAANYDVDKARFGLSDAT